jgi:hypothetical protein
MNRFYTYIHVMKSKLNLTISEPLLNKVKKYAASRQTSVSELVENYFQSIVKPTAKKNILEMLDQLDKPAVPSTRDLKKTYYEDQAGKYGF